MRELLDVNGRVFQVLSSIADMVMLNVLFVLCSLPIVTMGASITALSGVTLRMKDGDEGYAWKTFLHLFKQNFGKSTVLWLAMLLAGFAIALDLYMYRSQGGGVMTVIRILLFVGAMLWLLLVITIFPFMARTGTGRKKALTGAAMFAVGNAPKTLFMAVIVIAAAWLSLLSTGSLAVAGAFWILIGFSLLSWINSTLQIGTFRKMENVVE